MAIFVRVKRFNRPDLALHGRYLAVVHAKRTRYHVGASSRTSFGEAARRTKATDPTCRKTLRVRPVLSGLRGGPKWLVKFTYAGGCQSSDERGAPRRVDTCRAQRRFRRPPEVLPLKRVASTGQMKEEC